MIRVTSGDSRLYPLVKNKGVKSVFVERILNDLRDVDVKIVPVDYEFRKGGNEMIKISKL